MTRYTGRPRGRRLPARTVAAVGIGVVVAGVACADAGGDNAGPGPDAVGEPEAGSSAEPPGPNRDDVDVRALAAKLEPCPSDDRDSATSDHPNDDPSDDPSDDALPDVEMSCLGDDGSLSLAGLRGEPTVINVWATWCGPCRDEAPYLQQVNERAGERLRVLGINYEDPPAERALAFADDLGLRYAHLADPDGELREPLRLNAGIPVTVFVAADGQVVHRAHKPYRDVEELESDIADHLEVDL